jgi:hypothetical protein
MVPAPQTLSASEPPQLEIVTGPPHAADAAARHAAAGSAYRPAAQPMHAAASVAPVVAAAVYLPANEKQKRTVKYVGLCYHHRLPNNFYSCE